MKDKSNGNGQIVDRLLDDARKGKVTRRELMQGMLALGVTATAASSLWSTGVEAATPKKGGKMRMGKAHGSTTDSLDPATFENGFSIGMTHGVHGYLTEANADGSVGASVAESWEASADASTWVFKLRKGVTFHNGKTLTPKDVIASIDHHRGDDSKSAAKPIISGVKNMKADGDNVVFELESGNADFPFIVTDYHLPIMPEKDGKADWKSGIGAGAYKIKSYDPGVRADLIKNDGYYHSDRGHFDTVEMLTIVDPAARTNALISGEVDTIDRVDLKTVNLLKRRSGLKVHSIAGNQHYTFPMHTNKAPYDNNDVRLAIKYAVNRQEMVDKILQGYGSVGNDHPIGEGVQYFAKDLPQREYDPDKAMFHLKKAGLKSLEINLHSADAAFAGAVDAATLLAESAKPTGINLKVVREPNDGYWSNVWLKKDFCACYWSGRPTVDWMFSTAYEAGVAWNDTYWNHVRFNELLKMGRSELDEAKRTEIYFEMQKIVSDEAGTIVPMFAAYVFATSNKLGLPSTLASNWDLDGERWMERWWFA